MQQVEAVGIDQRAARELAAQADREQLAPLAKAAAAFDRARDAEEARAVGHLGDLGQDAVGLRKASCTCHKRTGAAMAREVERGRAWRLRCAAGPSSRRK